MTVLDNNIHWHNTLVSHVERESRNCHKSVILWFTGFSGSGKSTIAHAVERRLFELNCATFVLDGDNVRHGLCVDLEFSQQDRIENIRRIGEMAKLFTEAGMIALTAFISPYATDRDRVRALVEPDRFVEIYCCCSVEMCEKRDVKGLYAKARKGLIKDFTGISSGYEAPMNPELSINTEGQNLDECVDQVMAYLKLKNVIS